MPWQIWAIVAGSAFIVAATAGVIYLTRDTGRRAAPRGWDHIEEQWPSPGSWAGRTGSMIYDAELDYRARTGLLPINDDECGWVSGECQPPRNGDTQDELDPLPDMLPAGPVGVGPGLVDAALASAEEDPAGAGWTDELLADLHDAPTSLDGYGATFLSRGSEELYIDDEPDDFGPVPVPVLREFRKIRDYYAWQPEQQERLAETGEFEMVSRNAEYAEQLREQDADAAEFMSRARSDAAEFRLSLHGLT